MNIHEYQAKALLSKFDVPVPFGKVVFSAEEAGKVAYEDFVQKGSQVIVLKAQVHAGGRGKGFLYDSDNNRLSVDGKDVRGVNVITGATDTLSHKAYLLSKALHNNKLVTLQTGEKGKIVKRLLIEEGLDIAKEFYAGIVLDRQTSRNVIMVSTEGGMEIEEVAEKTPDKIIKEIIDPTTGFQDFQARKLAFALGLSARPMKSFVKFIKKLVHAYESLYCSLMEINPLVLTGSGDFIALDAKVNFDDNALYRHPDLAELRDLDEEYPLEIEASKYDLNYIKLDGNVGCMVNGAGLAMATMDTIKLSGGEPANFLDVGGGANVERIANAFRIMLSDSNVQAILINIFGGIVRCDRVANGIIQAMKQVEVNVPVIVRLEGTNAIEAREILQNSGLKFSVATTMTDVAEQVKKTIAA